MLFLGIFKRLLQHKVNTFYVYLEGQFKNQINFIYEFLNEFLLYLVGLNQDLIICDWVISKMHRALDLSVLLQKHSCMCCAPTVLKLNERPTYPSYPMERMLLYIFHSFCYFLLEKQLSAILIKQTSCWIICCM